MARGRPAGDDELRVDRSPQYCTRRWGSGMDSRWWRPHHDDGGALIPLADGCTTQLTQCAARRWALEQEVGKLELALLVIWEPWCPRAPRLLLAEPRPAAAAASALPLRAMEPVAARRHVLSPDALVRGCSHGGVELWPEYAFWGAARVDGDDNTDSDFHKHHAMAGRRCPQSASSGGAEPDSNNNSSRLVARMGDPAAAVGGRWRAPDRSSSDASLAAGNWRLWLRSSRHLDEVLKAASQQGEPSVVRTRCGAGCGACAGAAEAGGGGGAGCWWRRQAWGAGKVQVARAHGESAAGAMPTPGPPARPCPSTWSACSVPEPTC